jgi:signal transduction histidine kinase
MRLSVKMILFNLLAKGVLLLLFLSAGPYFFKHFAINYTDDRLHAKRDDAIDILRSDGMESFIDPETGEGYGSYNLLKEEYISIEMLEAFTPVDTIYNEERWIEDEVIYYRVMAFSFEEKGVPYLLEIGRSLNTIHQIEWVLSRFVFIAFLAFMGVSLFLDNTFNNYLLRPLYHIIRKKLVEIKEPQQYKFQKTTTSTVDFVILDKAIDDLMERIQMYFLREREFIAHASHELKTPVAVLQSKIENLMQEDMAEGHRDKLMDMLGTIQKFKRLINSLLLISKIGNSQFLREETVEIDQLLGEIYEEWQPMAEEKGIEMQLKLKEKATIYHSNYSLLYMMVQNAVKNAVKYTPDNGQISILGFTKSGRVGIEVVNSGHGIGREVLNQLKTGKIFVADAMGEKSGFGLVIMQKIADFLHIEMEITSSDKDTVIRFIC